MRIARVEFLRVIGKYRRLLGALARRDLSEDYVDHGFSLVWTVIQPLFAMAVYVFSFIYIFPTRVDPPDGFPTNAVIFLLAGITPWMILCQVMNKGLSSIVGHTGVVKQMAFPLELLPIKSLASPMLFGSRGGQPSWSSTPPASWVRASCWFWCGAFPSCCLFHWYCLPGSCWL